MTAAPRRWAAEMLHVWFHRLGPADWYGGGAAVDDLLRRRFVCDWQALRHRPAGEFLRDPLTAQAAILLFDQVPRNLFRGQARAFASDPLARTIARRVIARRWDLRLPERQRAFIAMPLMHSEDIADQRASLAYFAQSPKQRGFACNHYRMIARFGRFPHRNTALGRESTPAEKRAVAAGYAW
ncbi:DUF924 family protein [Pelagerythrobacter marensis]|uniref:DUF924 domain-containing protein n=1 Tax=Pelagerythrobacter marensis TaxID=543877 RepID=A0A0G3XBM9_9SPHN|nr:DUF924 family protein [Pelagerythrobacter marensis]AKM08562.1 hypothetical protein AM2010_2507 [Pelagerythrobacter marensis]